MQLIIVYRRSVACRFADCGLRDSRCRLLVGWCEMAAILDRTEAAEYYFRYIDQVGEGDICRILEAQFPETLTLLRSISDAKSLHRYGPDKWSIREVVSHVNDTERLTVSRAFWFARGFEDPLPSFDQNQAISTAGADDRSWT